VLSQEFEQCEHQNFCRLRQGLSSLVRLTSGYPAPARLLVSKILVPALS